MLRGLVLAAAIVGLIAAGLVGGQQSAAEAQQTASATRSFSEVAGGGTLTVTISVADYGGIGQLTETFPGDFTFEGSSPEVEPSGQTLTFNLRHFRELHAQGWEPLNRRKETEWWSAALPQPSRPPRHSRLRRPPGREVDPDLTMAALAS